MSYTGDLSGFLAVDASALGANMAATLEYDLTQKQVSAVVVDPRGFMFGWGANASGVLGGSLGSAVASPRAFLGVDVPVQVAFGGAHALVINAAGRLVSEDEFREIIVKTGEHGERTRLKDVARVELGSGEYALRSLLDGKPAVAVPFGVMDTFSDEGDGV